MNNQNENSPVEERSYVDTFIERYRSLIGEKVYMKISSDGDDGQYYCPEWIENFCKELELLRKQSKIVSEFIEYLKTKE